MFKLEVDEGISFPWGKIAEDVLVVKVSVSVMGFWGMQWLILVGIITEASGGILVWIVVDLSV
ncbi:hypothetical protein JI667_06165 [Bacillus sp. NTK074B]|uniref:hypothetical protein n=1 Tax=Bacillus sp. NTK074B TaxID=2802174 RepID=UPI001A8EADAB|nr:hypothetical protein [Bacillus sp. NTK074B]